MCGPNSILPFFVPGGIHTFLDGPGNLIKLSQVKEISIFGNKMMIYETDKIPEDQAFIIDSNGRTHKIINIGGKV